MKNWSEVAPHFAGTSVAHLATLEKDGSPHVVPLWSDRYGETDLVFFTIEGSRKDRSVARDPRVALSITAPDNAFDMASVRGEVVERIDEDRAVEIIDAISRKYTNEPYPARDGHVAFVVRPTRWWARDYSGE